MTWQKLASCSDTESSPLVVAIVVEVGSEISKKHMLYIHVLLLFLALCAILSVCRVFVFVINAGC